MMFLRFAPVAVVVLGLLWGCAGFMRASFIGYAGLLWLTFGVVYSVAQRRSPELVRERLRPPDDRDRATRRMVVPLLVLHCVVAGLDARFAWSAVPLGVQLAGFALMLAGLALAGWTVLSNPFASSAVRIQEERAQTLVAGGPYAIVRHPMYLGVVLCALGSGPALGSWPAGIVLAPVIAVFVRRTLLEERMLMSELAGYADYTRQVRYRIVPGVF